MSDTLSRLLFPMARGVFAERYWGREHMHLQRPGTGGTDWLNLDELDRLFESEVFPAALFNLVSDGKRLPLEEWSREWTTSRGTHRAVDSERLFQCYSKGATVIVNRAQRSIPVLSEACRLLTRELNFHLWTNICVTPPESSGFAPAIPMTMKFWSCRFWDRSYGPYTRLAESRPTFVWNRGIFLCAAILDTSLSAHSGGAASIHQHSA